MQTVPSATDDGDFETLLNLLTSDGIEDQAPVNSNPVRGDFNKSQGREDGKLDVKKIHSFYHNRRTADSEFARPGFGGPSDVSERPRPLTECLPGFSRCSSVYRREYLPLAT
jgi:hypothetical protein